jgi:hypothetical protein
MQERWSLVQDWHFLMEIGQSLPWPSIYVTTEANGRGVERRELEYPVRAAQPTEDELAQHGAPKFAKAALKVGAA